MRAFRFSRAFFLVGFALSMACSSDPPEVGRDDQAKAVKLVVTPSSPTLEQGEFRKLRVHALDANENMVEVPADLRWTSSDANVAVAYDDGQVRGAGPGKVTITVSSGSLSATATVQVKRIPLVSLRVYAPVQKLKVGQSTQFLAEGFDSKGKPVEPIEIEWSTTSDAFATIDATGLLTAHAPGRATIIAMAEGMESTATLEIVASEVAEVVRLERDSPRTMRLEVGKEAQFLVRAYDDVGAEIPDPPLLWTSSNPWFASIDQEGRVRAIEPGDTNILVRSGNAWLDFDVYVVGAPSFIEIHPVPEEMILSQTASLSGEVRDASGRELYQTLIQWESNDPSVLTISGTEAKAVGPGKVTITARSGEAAATVEVRVHELSLKQVALGPTFDCALTKTGEIFCWRELTLLGVSGLYNESLPKRLRTSLEFETITVGTSHLCGLTKGGKAYCLGHNTHGALGNRTIARSVVFSPVSGHSVFSSISAGDGYTCGLTLDREAWCWGMNLGGELGIGDDISRLEPTSVATSLGFSEIQAGSMGTTCALALDQSLHCWGRNHGDELETGTGAALRPRLVAAGYSFRRLPRVGIVEDSPLVSRYHFCGVEAAAAGRALCWGDNGYGQLGTGSFFPSLRPEPILSSFSYEDVQVGAFPGAPFSCGLTTDKLVFCWGDMTDGKTGRDRWINELQRFPSLIDSSHTFESLEVGSERACAIAEDGIVHCWGSLPWQPTGPSPLPGQIPP